MRWTELNPELPVQHADALVARYPGLKDTVILPGSMVILPASLRARVLEHLAASDVEQGGLLLGEVFALQGAGAGPAAYAVLLRECVPAADYAASAVSLRMGTDVWTRARQALGPLEMIAGWYHSHPGLGAFFSRRDRQTQRAFFASDWSVGWVMDPSDANEAWFIGGEARVPERNLTLPD